jgi:hypothetical protein
MLWPRILADLIVVLHASYVAFLVLGLAAIALGSVFRWTWIRNIYFRMIHLAMIAVVVAETVAGVPCPLTIWEKELRARAGQTTYPGDFLGHWVHQLIFYHAEPWVFTLVYVGFGLAVVATLILVPPRLPTYHTAKGDGLPHQHAC